MVFASTWRGDPIEVKEVAAMRQRPIKFSFQAEQWRSGSAVNR